MSLLRSLAEHFKDLGNGDTEPKSSHCGVCNEFDDFLEKHFKDSDSNEKVLAYRTMRAGFKSWPEFSGDPDYPVPYPGNEFSACGAYQNISQLWTVHDCCDEDTYGAARRRLCSWIARAFLANAGERYA